IRLDQPLRINVAISDSGEGQPVVLSFDLVGRTANLIVNGPTVTVEPKDNTVVEFTFPEDVTLDPSHNYIRVIASGGLTFTRYGRIYPQSKTLSVFVQTDRAVYQPGHTVKLRVLAMRPDLTVLQEPMNVVIMDPEGNRIQQWHDVTGDDTAGVVQLEMMTSLYPPLGTWTISATVQAVTKTKTFKIEEYELPRFELKLSWPGYALISDANVTGTVKATYTFGGPVHGKGKVTAKYDVSFYKPVSRLEKHFEIVTVACNGCMQKTDTESISSRCSFGGINKLDDNGEATVTFTLEELDDLVLKSRQERYRWVTTSSLLYSTIALSAEVKDTATDDVMKATTTLRFSNSPIRLEFKSSLHYKPGLDYTAQERSAYFYGGSLIHILTVVKTTDNQGQVSVTFQTPSRSAYSVEIRASSEKYPVSQVTRLYPFKSMSGEFLQIIPRTETPTVFAKSSLVLTGHVSQTENTRQRFEFRVTKDMAPIADLFVFYKRDRNSEIILDKIGFSVKADLSKLRLSYEKEEVRPGEEARLQLRGKPNSLVFLLGVDKSVTLLGGGNDITQSQVESELREYGASRVQGDPYSYPGYENPGSLLIGCSVNILTDGHVRGLRHDIPTGVIITPGPSTPSTSTYPTTTPVTAAQTSERTKATIEEPPEPEFETAEERIRKFFPETWLWETVLIGRKGNTVFTAIAPDTITTWITSAFAVHPTSGLTVADKRAEAWLMLDKNQTGFQNTLITRKSLNDPDSATEIRQSTYHTYYLGRLRPNTLTSKVFCIWPVSLGDVPLRVLLASTKPADGVERILRVVPEGVARAQSFPLLLQVPEDSDFVQTVTFTAPPGLVDGSLRLSVKITGDILGPIVENLDDLLKASYGCGEQNMVQFAPNTYVINYLRQTDQLTPELLAKSRRLMISVFLFHRITDTGYQRQLRYQHRDGSFSAFGDRYGSGQSGSMWLTAFVARCLAQASALGSDVISIDQNVVGRAAVWMADRQLFDGSFPEPGVVFNSRLQGGSAKGEARTAYVLIALAEVEIFLGHSLAQDTRSEVMSAVDSAVAFLESRLPLLTDPYDVCIVAYALTLTNSSKADVAIAKMLSVAVSEALTLHWERPEEPRSVRYPWYRMSDALSIEMTSYALLTLVLDQDKERSIWVNTWLNKQRGPYGGFISTQDTVVGIQALTAMAAFVYLEEFTPMTVTVSWTSGSPQQASVDIDNQSKLLLQTIEIPVVVVAEYNVDTRTVEQVFGVDPVVSDNTPTSFTLTTCAHRNSGPNDTMVEVDIGVPSGYWVDEARSRYGSASSRELKQQELKVILYYEA
ncbi:hypothetical protein BaRGS_00012395, partial [Batillaria attramentaria]